MCSATSCSRFLCRNENCTVAFPLRSTSTQTIRNHARVQWAMGKDVRMKWPTDRLVTRLLSYFMHFFATHFEHCYSSSPCSLANWCYHFHPSFAWDGIERLLEPFVSLLHFKKNNFHIFVMADQLLKYEETEIRNQISLKAIYGNKCFACAIILHFQILGGTVGLRSAFPCRWLWE